MTAPHQTASSSTVSVLAPLFAPHNQRHDLIVLCLFILSYVISQLRVWVFVLLCFNCVHSTGLDPDASTAKQ
jgi:hypothetical protein